MAGTLKGNGKPGVKPNMVKGDSRKGGAKWTKAQDDKADRRAGIKENSKRDKSLDKKRGVK